MFESELSELPAILVVEDDLGVQMILRRVARTLARGYELVTVSSGVAALEHVEQRPVPLVFTDFNLPGMNGLEIARAIKEIAPTTRIALVTAYATPELEQQAREQNIDYFVAKPFKIEQIEEIIREVVLAQG